MTDTKLVKRVHEELHAGYRITGLLSRFGGLAVFVWTTDHECLWQGDNVLEARAYIDAR